jgi:hypothetical protein
LDTKGRRTGSGFIVEALTHAVDEARHRLRHRLIMFAAYGLGYGARLDAHMAPWSEDPVVPLGSAKPVAAPLPHKNGRHAA